MKLCLFFEPSLLWCFVSCFSSLRRPHALFVTCFADFLVSSFILFLIFFDQSSFWVSQKKKMSFCFWTKVSKNITDSLFIIFWRKKNLFFLSFIIFCFWFFSCMISQKHFSIFFVFTFFFEKYLGSFALILIFLFKKNHLKKKVTLLIFLFTVSSEFVLSFLFRIFMFTLLAVTLLILHAFSLFLFFLFSLSMFPLVKFASRYVYLLTLSCASSVDSLFFWQFTFIFFGVIFFICSSLLAKLFLFYLLCCFAPFFSFVFSIVFFRTREIDLFFFGGQKNNLFNPSKNFFLWNSVIWGLKNLSSFFDFFEISFFEKSVFFEFRTKNPTKWHLQPTMFVPSDNLFVLRKISVSPAFAENVFFIISFLCLFIVRKFSWKNLSKKCFLKKAKLLLSPLDFCSIFFLRAKTLFYFFNCPFNFLRLSFSLFSFSVWFFFLVSFIFLFLNLSKQKSSKKISFEKFIGFFPQKIFWTFFGGGNIFWSKKCSKIDICIFFTEKNLP